MQREVRRHGCGETAEASPSPSPTPRTISRLGATTTLSRQRIAFAELLEQDHAEREFAAGESARDRVDRAPDLI